MDSNKLAASIRALGEKNDYQGQGTAFLEATGTTMKVVEAVPQAAAEWAKDDEHHGVKYVITLTNSRHSYTFDYWGSVFHSDKLARAIVCDTNRDNMSPDYFLIKDFLKDNGKKAPLNSFGLPRLAALVREVIAPSAYDVLVCLHPMQADTFEEWCSEFGYDNDSIRAERTYRACVQQDRAMLRMFTNEQLQALEEIN